MPFLIRHGCLNKVLARYSYWRLVVHDMHASLTDLGAVSQSRSLGEHAWIYSCETC